MWEERTSIRRREITNFSLHLFCLFWHNFGKKPSSVLFSFCQRDFKHNTVLDTAKLLLVD